ncbi:MAG TPA: hypothetical protein VFW30_00390 [Bryocella sp.]|nr:hypothetical protein [Bryocella sp.]
MKNARIGELAVESKRLTAEVNLAEDHIKRIGASLEATGKAAQELRLQKLDPQTVAKEMDELRTLVENHAALVTAKQETDSTLSSFLS